MKPAGIAAVALLALEAIPGAAAAEEAIPRQAVVRFAVACGRCHEGECSGRLSFSSGPGVAANHVRRYAPDATDADVSRLFALLKFTKEHCRPYPIAEGSAAPGRWTAGELDSWRDARSGGYYIPLGRPQAGQRRLRLVFDGPPRGRLRITDARFESVAEEQSCDAASLGVSLTATGGDLVLHLQSRARLVALEID